jgi:hypothetical protein
MHDFWNAFAERTGPLVAELSRMHFELRLFDGAKFRSVFPEPPIPLEQIGLLVRITDGTRTDHGDRVLELLRGKLAAAQVAELGRAVVPNRDGTRSECWVFSGDFARLKEMLEASEAQASEEWAREFQASALAATALAGQYGPGGAISMPTKEPAQTGPWTPEVALPAPQPQWAGGPPVMPWQRGGLAPMPPGAVPPAPGSVEAIAHLTAPGPMGMGERDEINGPVSERRPGMLSRYEAGLLAKHWVGWIIDQIVEGQMGYASSTTMRAAPYARRRISELIDCGLLGEGEFKTIYNEARRKAHLRPV